MVTHTKKPKKQLRTKDRLRATGILFGDMCKSWRDPHKVRRDGYYIWQYYPASERPSTYRKNENDMYAKHYCCIPYYSRYHAKDVIQYYFGQDVLNTCHIISGKKLIRQGIKRLPGDKRLESHIWCKTCWCKIFRWYMPIEFIINHSTITTRTWQVKMLGYRYLHDRKYFDKKYKENLLGVRHEFDNSTIKERSAVYYRFLEAKDEEKHITDEDLFNLQKEFNNYKSLFINPKDVDHEKRRIHNNPFLQ